MSGNACLSWGSTPLSTSKQGIEHVTVLPKNILGSNGGVVSSASETENWSVPIRITVPVLSPAPRKAASVD
jgi:hypothetical protein